MFTLRFKIGLALLCLVPALAHGDEPVQNAGPIPGEPAPPISVSKWVRGGPVPQFEKGRIYVVDLWSSWCGPCLKSMPELSRIEKRHSKDVTVIAMNVWEMQPARIPALVKSFGDSIASTVAMDSLPPGKEANEGLTALTYLGTSVLASVPQSFLIDRDGRLAWVGHPKDLESPLGEVIEGRWNVEPFAGKYIAGKNREMRYTGFLAQVEKAVADSSWDSAYAISEEAAGADSSYAPLIAGQGFGRIASSILALKSPGPGELETGKRAAERALSLDPDPGSWLYRTAAHLARASGDLDGARHHLRKAIEKASDEDRPKLQEELNSLPNPE